MSRISLPCLTINLIAWNIPTEKLPRRYAVTGIQRPQEPRGEAVLAPPNSQYPKRAPREISGGNLREVCQMFTPIIKPLANRYENRSRKSRRESFSSHTGDVLIQVEGREINEPTGLYGSICQWTKGMKETEMNDFFPPFFSGMISDESSLELTWCHVRVC